MPVRSSLMILLMLGISQQSFADDSAPSLDLLEYLGSLETEVDGQIVNPVDLDLIADNQQGEEKDNE